MRCGEDDNYVDWSISMDAELLGSERENTANKSAEVADHEFGAFFKFSPKHSSGS